MSDTATETTETETVPEFDWSTLPEGLDKYGAKLAALYQEIRDEAEAVRAAGGNRNTILKTWRDESPEAEKFRTEIAKLEDKITKVKEQLNAAADEANPKGKTDEVEQMEASLKDKIKRAKGVRTNIVGIAELEGFDTKQIPEVPTGSRTYSGGSSTAHSNGNSGAIRKWARDNGHPVGERGRIDAKIVDLYNEAHAA